MSTKKDLDAMTGLKTSSRIVGIDIAKTVGIMLVVMIHFVFITHEYPDTWLSNFITVSYQYGVPLFFMANGAILLNRPLNLKKHYHRLLTIVVVTLIWKIIDLALFGPVFGNKPIGIRGGISYILGVSEFPGRNSGFIWFMNVFIALQLIFPLIKIVYDSAEKTAQRIGLGILVTFSFGLGTAQTLLAILGYHTGIDFLSMIKGLNNFYLFSDYSYAIAYFVLGGIILKKFRTAREENNRIVWPYSKISIPWAVALLIVCQILLFITQLFQSPVSGYALRFDYSYVQIPGFIGSLVLFSLFLMVQPSKRTSAFFESVGSETFGIYMVHIFLILLVDRAQTLLFVNDDFAALGSVGSILVNLLMAGVVFFVAYGISLIGARIPVVKKLFFH